MIRKLCSLGLCAFALLFLMGAADEAQQVDNVTAKEKTVVSEVAPKDMVETNAVTGANPLELRKNVERGLKVDEAYAQRSISLTEKNGVSYVSLMDMAKELDEKAVCSLKNDVVTITTAKMKITAKVGQQYIEANGRYFYLPDGVKKSGNQVIVPLWAVIKAFDAKMSWNAENGVVMVKSGSGAVKSGSSFYNKDTLFWLSRIIYAESGNQSLDGQMAVGNVIMNRVNNPAYPNTITGVLSQKNQFSPWKDGSLANRTPNSSSVISAKLVLDGGVVPLTKGALYFDSTGTGWASRNRQFIAVLGSHYFYL